MVCISAGLADHLDGFIHGKGFLIHQNSDQLRNHHGRMGIVNLNHRMIVHLAQIIFLFFHFLQNQLRCIAYHKILLIDTQQIPRLVRIVRIQEQSQILLYILFVKINSLFHQTLVQCFQIKQSQFIDTIVISNHIYVIKP